ncbi:TRAP transporter small permease subunit [Aurantimonas sp. A2-1-M11]|uniref:TRAP transporter small permease n=1 Tax=Aurantimonas sp. A2-1-M11 TaxID=3113712 RepID=UPI002F945121
MRTFYQAVLRAEAILAGTLLLLMVGLIFGGGIARMMHSPINWTIDFATCFFAWACFLCADIAWRKDALMSIDVIKARLPEGARHLLQIANNLMIMAFLGVGIYAGIWLAWISRARSFQGIPAISYSWVTMSLPVGALLLLITTIVKLRAVLRDRQADSAATAAAKQG